MTSIPKIRDSKCKGNFEPIEGVELPGGFMMRKFPTVLIDLRRGSIDIFYIPTFKDISSMSRRALGTMNIQYNMGSHSFLGQPTCYREAVYPSIILLTPPYILDKKSIEDVSLPDDFYRMIMKYDVLKAITPMYLSLYKTMMHEEDHIFLFDNPNNTNVFDARDRLWSIIEKYNPGILQQVWDDKVPDFHVKVRSLHEISNIISLEIENIKSLRQKHRITSDEAMYMQGKWESYRENIYKTLDDLEKELAHDALSKEIKSQFGRKYSNALSIPDNMYELRFLSDLPPIVFMIISRYVGFKKAVSAIADALDKAFDRDAPMNYHKIYTTRSSYTIQSENHYPWMHFRERVLSRTRFEQKSADTYTSRFEGISITFMFDPDVNEILMDHDRGPVISINTSINDIYLKRPKTENLYTDNIVSIRVRLPSFVGMGKELWNKTEAEMRLLLDTMLLDSYAGEKGYYWVRSKKKLKRTGAPRELRITKELIETAPPLIREAEKRLYATEYAEREGRVSKDGTIIPRKPDNRLVKIFDKKSKTYIQNLRNRHLELRDKTDEEIFEMLSLSDRNRIIDATKNEYFTKIVDMWVRNLKLYYSQIIDVYTDFLRTQVAGYKAKNTSMTGSRESAYAYKAMIEAFRYILANGR